MQIGLRSSEDRKILQPGVEGPLHLVSSIRKAGLDEEIRNIVSDVVDVIEIGRSCMAQRRSLPLDDEEGLSLRGRRKRRVGLRDRKDELIAPLFERVAELEFVPWRGARFGGGDPEEPTPLSGKTLLCSSTGFGALLEALEGIWTRARNGRGKG